MYLEFICQRDSKHFLENCDIISKELKGIRIIPKVKVVKPKKKRAKARNDYSILSRNIRKSIKRKFSQRSKQYYLRLIN